MTLFGFFSRLQFRIWSQRDALLLVRPTDVPVEPSLIEACPGTFVPVSEENLHDCAAFEDRAHYVPTYRKMLEAGSFGHFGYLDGTCVYREWLQQKGEVLFDGCPVLQLRENEGYSCYVFCDPRARGNGFQAAGIAHMAQRFPELTFYTIVLTEKKITRKNYLKNGYVPHTLITVKNRFFHRTLTRKELSPEEAKTYLC